MTAISFRYDFDENEQDMNPCAFISRYLREFYPGIVGVETRNKYGETIKKHMHYNFYYPEDDAKKWVEKIRKAIQRENNEKGDNKRGKGYYSLTIQDVEDRDRWLRYPLKQYNTFAEVFKNSRIKIPDDFDLELQWKIANEEYTRDLQFLSRRRETEDRRQTTYQKILASIEEEGIKFDTKRSIFSYVLQYHMNDDIPVDRMKFRSYTESIAIKQGIMSEEEFYELSMR